MFDVNKIKDYYNKLIAERDEAVVTALADKDARVQEAFDLAKAEIEAKIIAEITAEAEAPYLHDIELCQNFMADEKVAEEVDDVAKVEDETTVVVGE